MESFQKRCANWAHIAFGFQLWTDPHQRCARFFEEAVELCQALRVSKQTVLDTINMIEKDMVIQRFLTASVNFCGGHGMTIPEMHMLADYVYGRPVGEVEQEVGGVMVTLALMCELFNTPMKDTSPHRALYELSGAAHFGYGIDKLGERELARIMEPEVIEKIRKKHASKPKAGPLPGSA